MAMPEAKRRDFIMSREHMDIRELAKTLKVCEEVVRRWIRDGNLFAVKDGMKWWIPRTDARLFIDEYKKKGETLKRHAPAAGMDDLINRIEAGYCERTPASWHGRKPLDERGD